MQIDKRVEKALEEREDRGERFHQQIEQYRMFKKQLDAAGVTPKKEEFTIPLIERIAS